MITCHQCGLQTKREFTIIATFIRETEKRIIIELTEPQERTVYKDRKKLFCFPFYLNDGNEELDFCTLNCLKLFMKEKLFARKQYEKTKR